LDTSSDLPYVLLDNKIVIRWAINYKYTNFATGITNIKANNFKAYGVHIIDFYYNVKLTIT